MTAALPIYHALKGMGLHKGYCSQLANRRRAPGLGLAIEIFEATGFKLGPIASATDQEIAALRAIAPPSRRGIPKSKAAGA